MTPAAPRFDLKFHNIPTINLRVEFDSTYAFVNSDEAEQSLRPPIQPIRFTLMIWGGMPEDLFTLLLQRAVLGVEAYLPSALLHASAALGNASSELSAKLRNPSKFGASSLVANIYHRMPAAVHPELSLRHLDQELYEQTVAFYREVRNPIFHGKQLAEPSISQLRSAFSHIARLYGWIDYWHNPAKAYKSPVVVGPFSIKLPSFVSRAP